MSKALKTGLLKYGISTLVCGLLSWAYIANHSWEMDGAADTYRVLCDGFMIPGIMVILVGALVFLSNEGALSGVRYAVKYAFQSLFPGGRRKQVTYYEYMEERKEKRVRGYRFLFIVGGAFAAVGLVFLVLFYSV